MMLNNAYKAETGISSYSWCTNSCSGNDDTESSGIGTGAIVGIVIAILVVVGLVIGGIIFYRRKQAKKGHSLLSDPSQAGQYQNV